MALYRLRVDTYRRGGAIETETLRETFASVASAFAACDDMQRQFDYDCQPVTVWVVDCVGVAVYRVRGFDPPGEHVEPENERRRIA